MAKKFNCSYLDEVCCYYRVHSDNLSKKQKVDIKKISILELANQYLNFVEANLENLKLTADYLVMASLLAYLKSKLLIPEEKDEVQEIQEDLTQRIIHYNAIKKL